MSDRTYAQVIVWDCPDDQRAACLAAIFDAFGSTPEDCPTRDTTPEAGDWRDVGYQPGRFVPETETLVLGATYGEPEMPLDAADTIAEELREAAPGATFETWVDPKYEYGGELRIVAPDLGLFGSECNADGAPLVASEDLVRLIDHAESLDALRAEIATRTGAPWLRRVAELRAAVQG